MSAAENLVLADLSLQFCNVTQQIRKKKLTPTEKIFNWFNAGKNINKAICIDYKFGDDYCLLFLISDINSTKIKILNLAFICH